MRLTGVPTELTTAATDLVLGLFALGCSFYLWTLRGRHRWKAGLWAWTFGLLAGAAFLGTAAHALEPPNALRNLIWQPLFLLLGLVVALFVVGATYDWRGRRAAGRLLPAMLVVAAAFFGVTRLASGAFLVFVVYEAIAMLAAFGVYAGLAVRRALPGAGLVTVAIALNLVAAGIQASESVRVTVIWPFDHNGVFHLVQMVAIGVLIVGLRRSLERGVRETQPT